VAADVLPQSTVRVNDARTDPNTLRASLLKSAGAPWSQLTGSWTVEMHAYRQESKKRWIVHLVNYNHKENAPGKSVSARESPIVTENLFAQLKLPAQTKVRQVRFLSPDDEGERQLPFRQEGEFVRFTAPPFLVYGVCVVEE
jgi:hypothetical protein